MLKYLKPASHRSLPDNDDLPDCATSRILACGIVRDRELLYFSPPSLFLFVARPTQLIHSLFIKFSIVAPVFFANTRLTKNVICKTCYKHTSSTLTNIIETSSRSTNFLAVLLFLFVFNFSFLNILCYLHLLQSKHGFARVPLEELDDTLDLPNLVSGLYSR